MSLVQSTSTSTNKAMASPQSPLPLAGLDSSELSITGLLSPEIDLTKDMSEELDVFFKDLQEEYTKTPREPAAASAGNGYPNPHPNMPSSQCAQQPPTALGYSINTDQGSAGVKPPLAIPEVLSARTLASAQAMVRAAENTLSGAFPGTPSSIHKSEYGPTNANGPYGHRKQEERPTQAWNEQQREI